MSTNSDSMKELRCPVCGHKKSLQIAGTALFNVYDNGTKSHAQGRVAWDAKPYTRCPECGFEGVLQDFYISNQTKELQMRTYEVVILVTHRFVGKVKAPGSNEVNLLFQEDEDVAKHCTEDNEFYEMEIKDIQEVKGGDDAQE